jgi:putative tricarboxylic transport membrane protein
MLISANIRKSQLFQFGVVLYAVFAAFPQTAAADEWKPEKSVAMIVGSSPGSGTDVTARYIQKIIRDRKMLEVPMEVVNKPGGGSAIAFADLAQHARDPHYFVLGSYNLVTNHITGKSKLGIDDFTPMALLFNDYVSFNVKADSSIRSGDDLIGRVKKDPQSVTFGLSSSVAGANYIALALVMKNAGVNVKKLKIVIFSSGGNSATAVLGGHVDVQVVSASIGAKQIEAKQMRMLAIASPRRLQGTLAGIPTWKELGVPVIASNWRNIIGPKDMTADQIAYWDQLFGQLTHTDEWKAYLDQSFSDNAYMNSAQTRKYLEEQSAEIKSILLDLGLVK